MLSCVALVSINPFWGNMGSATVSMDLKNCRLSNERCILICLTFSRVFVQLTMIRLPPAFFTEKSGSVSCANNFVQAVMKIKKTKVNLTIIVKSKNIACLFPADRDFIIKSKIRVSPQYFKNLTFLPLENRCPVARRYGLPVHDCPVGRFFFQQGH